MPKGRRAKSRIFFFFANIITSLSNRRIAIFSITLRLEAVYTMMIRFAIVDWIRNLGWLFLEEHRLGYPNDHLGERRQSCKR